MDTSQPITRALLKEKIFIFTFLVLLVGVAAAEASARERSERTPDAASPRVTGAYGRLPLHFEANQGQTDARVKFVSRGDGYTLFLAPTEAMLSLRGSQPQSSGQQAELSRHHAQAHEAIRAVLHMQLVGANSNPKILGLEELPGKSHFFIGNDPSKWLRNIPTYAKVAYKDVYPGVDLVFYGNQRQLEYDFVITPGADPGVIRLAFNGPDELTFDGKGNLVLRFPNGQVILRAPVIYQDVGGIKQAIPGRYVLVEGSHEVVFDVVAYDTTRPLVIDPVLSYSTYLGGSGTDLGVGLSRIAVDSSGNAYVTGFTSSTDFPTASPLQAAHGGGPGDAFVTKLNPTGSALVYSTYLGGNDFDKGSGIAVDASGNVYVIGITGSGNFPTKNPLQPAFGGDRDVFVAKLNPTGSELVYSTYLGGSGREHEGGISVDTLGNAYVTGGTTSTNFPTKDAFQPSFGGDHDAFVAKINPDGSALVYSTYLGGSRAEEGISSITVDAGGNAYVTGITMSADFPTKNPLQPAFGGDTDAFVAKLNPNGSALVYATYLGGGGHEQGAGIHVDVDGSAYVTGLTDSTDFSTKNPLQPVLGGSDDAFVAKLTPDGSALVYATYLGGGAHDGAAGIDVDANGNAYVTGRTDSTDFPTKNPLQPALSGLRDAFVAKVNPSGSTLIYATYLGGSNLEEGMGIALDSSGIAYVVGATNSTDFPTIVGAFQTAFGGGSDGFVAKISDGPITSNVVADPNPVPVFTAISLTANVAATLGGSIISAAEYSIDGGSHLAMDPQDGVFDEVSEDVIVIVPGFPEAGVHDICVRGTDSLGNISPAECIFLAVFDSAAGFVTGGGWIDSPEGAYISDPSLIGKASFGFVSRYQKGAKTPIGVTEFRFRVAGLNFHSDIYEWLVVAGARAQYKGTGTINGGRDYGFLLTAIDGELAGVGGVDKFRIKIWDRMSEQIVYDNQLGSSDTGNAATELGGGSIVIHKK